MKRWLLTTLAKLVFWIRPGMIYAQIKERMNTTLPFVNHVGIRVTEVGDGTAVAVMPERTELHNHIATPHAGAMFTLAESASGAAMAGALGPLMLSSRPVAADAQIRYQKLAKGDLTARARVPGDIAGLRATLERNGKVSFPVEVEILDGQNIKSAEFTATWHVSRLG